MSLIKKWMSCALSLIAGVLGLAMSACTGMVVNAKIDATAIGGQLTNTTEKVKAFEVITDSSLYNTAKDLGITTEFVWLKVFAIVMLVVSIALIVYAIIMALKNFNVIKSEHKVFDIIGYVLTALLLIAGIGLMITSNVYASALETAQTALISSTIPAQALSSVKIDIVASMGLYQPFMLATSIVVAIVVAVIAFLKRKDA